METVNELNSVSLHVWALIRAYFVIYLSIQILNSLKHSGASQQSQSVGAALLMAKNLFVLFVLCIPVGSLATTTRPQQQSSGALKDLCEVSTILLNVLSDSFIFKKILTIECKT